MKAYTKNLWSIIWLKQMAISCRLVSYFPSAMVSLLSNNRLTFKVIIVTQESGTRHGDLYIKHCLP